MSEKWGQRVLEKEGSSSRLEAKAGVWDKTWAYDVSSRVSRNGTKTKDRYWDNKMMGSW